MSVSDENAKETGNRIGSFDDIIAFAEEIKSTTLRTLILQPHIDRRVFLRR
ncbi:MAG: hypothetical protein OXU36_18705 [Candidatus Poribacteria bacterium]|nr:hypothetical protein [Candidatus Poribacteria bacterium]